MYVEAGIVINSEAMSWRGAVTHVSFEQSLDRRIEAVTNGTASMLLKKSSLLFVLPRALKGVHKLSEEGQFMTSKFLAKAGSPVAKVIRVTLSRFYAAGLNPQLVSLFENKEDTRQYVMERETARREPSVSPLGLVQLWVCFVLLAGGLLAATITFSGELLVFRLQTGSFSPHPSS
ncbi:uncharacterized protein LOC117650895 [Thrips palmi]|uniref:Uncharacterized protein LOC117650895 n=1 Tax=Thrips palmi TaxID=161013 RepID=A0A6P8ZYC3_THRPL|nr:uncharacterized protein LOC117650895 [Thrips palmi]